MENRNKHESCVDLSVESSCVERVVQYVHSYILHHMAWGIKCNSWVYSKLQLLFYSVKEALNPPETRCLHTTTSLLSLFLSCSALHRKHFGLRNIPPMTATAAATVTEKPLTVGSEIKKALYFGYFVCKMYIHSHKCIIFVKSAA